MGRNTLEDVSWQEDWSPEEVAIIKRRETLSDGSKWPMEDWDYTEWEEFLHEVKNISEKT